MRITTNGIGIDTVSCTLTGMAIYGNDKFVEWGRDGIKVSRIIPERGDQPMTIELTRTSQGYPTVSKSGRASWIRNWSKSHMPGDLVPKFGQTSPVLIRLDGPDKIEIIMPPAEKRARLLRPTRTSRKNSPELPLDTKGCPENESKTETAAPTAGLDDLRSAVRRVNQLRRDLNARLTLSDGDLIAIVELK